MALLTCTGCNSKMRVPDSAAGKRVKCPKCAAIIQVPEAETPAEPASPAPDTFGVSEKPLPPPKEEAPAEPAGTEIAAEGSKAPPWSGAKPPPLKSSRAKSKNDYDDDEDDEPPRKKRRDDDDDDDEDDARERQRRSPRRDGGPSASGMALASMIVGIASIVVGIPSCCCGLFAFAAGSAGLVAVILGFLSKKSPGSESMALAGIICGFVGIGIALIYVALVVLYLFGMVGLAGMQGMNLPNNPPPRFK